MKKIGVVGCGVVADYGHLPTIKQIDGLELTALYDPNETNLKSAQEKFSVPHAFTNIDEFYKTDIDAVVVTSPAPCHKENVIDAARHGKHILCEKPLGMTSEEIQEMIKVAEDANVMLFTAFDYRFSPVSQTIKQLVREKAVGEVKSLRLIYIWNMHGKYTIIDGQKVVPQRRIGRMEEGGPMVDCGVHQIDLARWWLESEVVRWCGEGAWVDEYEAPDHVYVHMDHENGAHTMVEISYSTVFTAAEPISHFTYQLIGTDGLIRLIENCKY